MEKNNFYKLCDFILGIIFKIFYRLEVTGLENVPRENACVIASNHVSLFDPPLLGVAMKYRPINFMAKEELFVFILGTAYKKLGAFPVKRGAGDLKAIKHAIKLLNDGNVLAIFPEGTRSKNGKLGKATPGAMSMAVKTNSIVVPTALKGPNKVSWLNPFPKFKVSFGKPIDVKSLGNGKEVIDLLNEKMMISIQEQLNIM